ncbi:MAG: YggS family pyridoxal phosphate-dependent enzyme [Bacteroidetes Order II. Incertae sedis bacterium]|nr:YggS family pyridoxal phosphate-dependent enzyme [Bacteroidetes Order II. bacterium]
MTDRKENLLRVKERIAESARLSDRQPDDVTLIAVSKTFPSSAITELASYGQIDFGENKVQELVSKHQLIGNEYANHPILWHFIGHLQRNKAKDIVGHCNLFHALDSSRLARALDTRLKHAGQQLDCLIQVNVSGEASKFGLEPAEVDSFQDEIAEFSHVRIRGFMTLASPSPDAERVRPQFARLRHVLEASLDRLLPDSRPILSMGMSGDFHVAIEEGATHVRVGSAVFGPRSYGMTK